MPVPDAIRHEMTKGACMNTIEQQSTIISTKIHETAISVLQEDFLNRFPREAAEFEGQAEKLYEAGPSGFVERYDRLLVRYLNKLGYAARYQHLVESVGQSLAREQQEMNLFFKVKGRETLLQEYGQHPILMKGTN